MKQLGPTDLKRLHREWNRRSTRRLALLLDGISSPFNVGAIARTAAAFRVDHLYLGAGATSPRHNKAGKTALGTDRYLSWSVFERSHDAADTAREDGFAVIGLELADHAIPLHVLDAGPDVCLAVGHEDHGLSPATLAACDAVAFLPQMGRVGSLNVATAASIALYELRRKEWS
ncbi:MAG: TrmH family RNA methyltransferase [Actinomycetota bacterium]|nr:TrmH family RNA methyltransferase [Actinomycetota bacterium]MDQ6945710.1 TrmH family RNA methyltransferase [Actinomycetota bacterium]